MRALVPILLCLLSSSQQSSLPPRDAPSRQATAAGTGIIRGRVIEEDTRGPVAWALVIARDDDDSRSSNMAHTDERGRFEVRDLQPGHYRVTVLPPQNRGRYLVASWKEPIDVAGAGPTEPIEVVLPRAAALGGRVLDETGEPLADVRVQPWRLDPQGERSQPAGISFNGTDDRGRFRVFGLADGEYVVVATAQPQHARTSGSPPGFVETFYPSALDVGGATRLRLKPGQDLDDLEITMVRVKTFSISGIILAPDGQPAGGVSANLHHLGGNGEELRVDALGRFNAGGLVPGMYDVFVSGGMNAPNMFARTRVTVADADLTDIVITSRAGVDVSGRLTVAQEKARPPSGVGLTITQVDPDWKASWIPTDVRVGADASFVLTRLFGTFIIRPKTPPGWALGAVLLNGTDITDTPYDFREQDSGHLEVVLTRRASSLEGRVKDNRGRPSDNVAVVLFSSNRADWIPESSRTRVAYSQSDARFRFDGVRPGRYWVTAVSRERAVTRVPAPAALEALIKDATEVVVGEDEHRVIEVALASHVS